MKDLRQNYTRGQLLEQDLPEEPFSLFENWFQNAMDASSIIEPNAMVLSTVVNSAPDSRIVLLKDLRDEEFVFYTNYHSHKGQQLAQIPHCNLLFPWIDMQRQVIVRGVVKKVSAEESDEYFFSRPLSSQIGALVSDQSSEVASRQELDEKLAELTELYKTKKMERPEHWGGYAIEPLQIEYWQGRENRLHDRILYKKEANIWSHQRLQP